MPPAVEPGLPGAPGEGLEKRTRGARERKAPKGIPRGYDASGASRCGYKSHPPVQDVTLRALAGLHQSDHHKCHRGHGFPSFFCCRETCQFAIVRDRPSLELEKTQRSCLGLALHDSNNRVAKRLPNLLEMRLLSISITAVVILKQSGVGLLSRTHGGRCQDTARESLSLSRNRIVSFPAASVITAAPLDVTFSGLGDNKPVLKVVDSVETC